LFNGLNDTNGSSKNINYSTFISKLKDNQMSVIDVDGRTITGKTNEGESFVTYSPLLDGSLVNKLEDSNAIVKATAP
ncbi:ATP-dependent metallopeptidase FtsH/Yme1/Tma family protein, partial [Francisella tularensis subsp. holarctica]|uniref:ATP-dependent metallopeptidase FtsH/Yme1/Tma family protein n=1 Tax=Francisella tularensis TaxID=263 RepID=UPI002381ACA7